MKTKQEVIQEAYQEYEVDFSKIDQNGWTTDFGAKYDYWDGNFDLLDSRHRPKSLAGIETNNGWIRIESEDWLKTVDREKGVTFYYVNSPDEDYFDIAIQLDDKEKSIVRLSDYLFMLEELNKSNIKATHYQPINKIPSAIY